MQGLIESLPSAIVFVEDGVIVEWNRAATSLYGWSAHEVTGLKFLDVLAEIDDRDQLEAVLDDAAERGKWSGNFRLRRKDGALLVSSFQASLVQEGDQERIAWVATDPIDQHLAEQEREALVSAQNAVTRDLEATLGLLEALLECAPIGIAVLDLELCCTHANTTFQEMISVRSSPVGAYLDDLATLPAEVAADLRRVVTTGRSISDRRLALRTGSGSPPRSINANYFPIYASHDLPAGAGLTWTDITAAELAEGERDVLVKQATAAQHRLALLSSTSAVLMGTTDVDTLIERVSRVLAPAASDWCVIELVGRTGMIEHVAASHSDRHAAQELRDSLRGQTTEPTGDSVIGRARRTGQAQLLTGAVLERAVERVVHLDSHRMFGELDLTSTLVVPIKTRAEVIGVLILANSGPVTLTEEDLDVAVEIAHRMALVVDRVITFQTEHVLAGQLQQALLPRDLPAISGCTIATRYSASADAATVGGDWYDVLQLSPSRAMICVGDVVGHDTDAAVAMSRLRYLIHAFATESAATSTDGIPDPAEILERVDRLVYDDLTAWGTCVLAVLDTAEGELRWTNAGHPPVLLCRDGTVRALVGGDGAMLGVSKTAQRHVATTKVFAGDRLLMYTDGLVERRGESLDVGLARLTETMHDYRNQPLERMCTELIAAMLLGTRQTDDIALLAAELYPIR
ncbi:MAG: regulatory protein [Acidimicrobiales bacterium]|nr:regulatory protein [Acidimicrobiales bacterium]